MSKHRSVLVTLAILAALISPASAQAPGAKVGMLGCTLSPTVGLFVGSLQTIACTFTPDGPYPPEAYVGTFGTLGLDIGVVAVGGLAWQVYNQSNGPLINSLAGTYVGGSGEIGVGVGVGANVLFGGSARQVALQPVSLEGEVALNLELGVSTLILRPAY
jgi:hypothetical protein